jgi:hypothetical protein
VKGSNVTAGEATVQMGKSIAYLRVSLRYLEMWMSRGFLCQLKTIVPSSRSTEGYGFLADFFQVVILQGYPERDFLVGID